MLRRDEMSLAAYSSGTTHAQYRRVLEDGATLKAKVDLEESKIKTPYSLFGEHLAGQGQRHLCRSWTRICFWEEHMGSANKSKAAASFDVTCPECGGLLKVDAATHSVIAHTPAPRKRTFEDLEAAARGMREQDERKQSIFRQSVDAVKNQDDLMEKRFAEAMRKAKETPGADKPLREFDLD